MEKELLEILDKARQSGASKEQLQGIVDAYKLKKKDSPQPYQPTSEEPTEVSKIPSESIDLGVYPTAFTPKEDIEKVSEAGGISDEKLKRKASEIALESTSTLRKQQKELENQIKGYQEVFNNSKTRLEDIQLEFDELNENLSNKYGLYYDAEQNAYNIPKIMQPQFNQDVSVLNQLQKDFEEVQQGIKDNANAYRNSANRYAINKEALAQRGTPIGTFMTNLISEGVPTIVGGLGAGAVDLTSYTRPDLLAMRMAGGGAEQLVKEGAEELRGKVDKVQDEMSNLLYDKIGVHLGSTKEYIEQQTEEGDFWNIAAGGLGTSIPAMLTAGLTGGASFYAQMYDFGDEAVKDVEGLSEGEKIAYKILVASITGELEKRGFSSLLKNKAIANSVVGRVLKRLPSVAKGKSANVSDDFINIVLDEGRIANATLNSAKQRGIDYGGRIVTGFLAEAETGGLQSLAENSIEQSINLLKGEEVFDSKDWYDFTKEFLFDAAAEGVGGAAISGTIGLFSRKGATQKQFDAAAKYLGDIRLEAIGAALEADVEAGNMTKEQAKATYDKIKQYKEDLARLPEDFPDSKKGEAVSLIQKRNGLQEKLGKVDESFKPKVQQEIDNINAKLAEMGSVSDADIAAREAEVAAKEAEEELSFFEDIVEGGASEARRVYDEEKARVEANAEAEVERIVSGQEAMAETEAREAQRKANIAEATVTGETMAVEREAAKPSKREGDKAKPKDLTKTEGEQDFTEAERPTPVTSAPATRTPEQEKMGAMVSRAKEAQRKARQERANKKAVEEAVKTPPTAEVSEDIGPEVDFVTDDELADAMVQGAETPSVNDKILNILDKAIDATSTKGRAFDATLGLPMFMANSALKIVRAAYKGGMSLADAVKKGYNFVRSQGYELDLDAFDAYVKQSLTGKKETEDAVQEQAAGEVPVQPEAEVGGEMEEGVPDTEPQEATQEGKKPRVAKDKKGITSLMERVFGLNKSKSKAAARIYDIAIGTIAERAGITKEEAYRRIGLVKADKKLMEQIQKNPAILFQVIAFHGSPYQFDKFLTEAIGTGEGAQAFGWGLYFTDLESIARYYADKLTPTKVIVDGKVVDRKEDFFLYRAAYDIANLGYERAVERNKELVSDGDSDAKGILDAIEGLKGKNVKFGKDAIVYKVTLFKGKTPDQYTWLEWDKTLSKKIINSVIDKIISEGHIQKLKDNYLPLRRAIPFMGNKGKSEAEITRETLERFFYDNKNGGKYLQEFLNKNIFGNYKDVSAFLLRAGVDGVKYPAESVSRGATSDTARGFNYVVFDENAVSIEEVIKFQKDAIAARGAMMMGMDAIAIIYALTDPNVSTPLHELAHVYEHYLTEQERADIEAWSGHKSGTVEFSEAFARGFEKYLADGKAPTDKLKKVFENFKKWLTEIYDGITGSEIDLELNDKMRSIYDAMLGGEVTPENIRVAQTKVQLPSIKAAMPFLDGFDITKLTEDQINLLNEVMETYLETGELVGDGTLRAIVEGIQGAESNGPNAKMTADSLDIRAGEYLNLIAAIMGRSKNAWIRLQRELGLTGENGLTIGLTKPSVFRNNFYEIIERSTGNKVYEKGTESRVQVVGIVLQRIGQMVGNRNTVEQVINDVLDDFQRTAEYLKVYGDPSLGDYASNIEKAVAKVRGATTADEVLSKLTPKEKEVLEVYYEANNVGIDEKIEVSKANGRPLKVIPNYLHIPIRSKTVVEPQNSTPTNNTLSNPAQINISNAFAPQTVSTKSTGAQKSRVANAHKLPEGSYYDPMFFSAQAKSFNNTNVAIFTYQAIQKMNAFLSTGEAVERFGGGKRGRSNIEAFQKSVNQALNAESLSAKASAELRGFKVSGVKVGETLNTLQRIAKKRGIVWVMARPAQFFLQAPVVINTIGHVLMSPLMLKNPIAAMAVLQRAIVFQTQTWTKEKGWANRRGLPWADLIKLAPAGIRDIRESFAFMEGDSEDVISRRSGITNKAIRVYDKADDSALKYSVAVTDRASAQISWLALYETYMLEKGLVEGADLTNRESYNEWWKSQGQNPNYDAIAYADTMVAKDQNASANFQRAILQTDKSAFEKLFRSLVFPLINFKINKIQSIRSESKIISTINKKVTAEDRLSAGGRLLFTAAEMYVYHQVSIFLVGAWKELVDSMWKSATAYITGDDDDEIFDEDDMGKTIKNQKRFWTRWITESAPLLSTLNIDQRMQNGMAEAYNFMCYQFNKQTDTAFASQYPEYESYARSGEAPAKVEFIDEGIGNAGYLGIVAEQVMTIDEMWEAAMNGERENQYGEMIYYTPEQQQKLKLTATLATINAVMPSHPLTAEVFGMVNRSFYKENNKAYENMLARDLETIGKGIPEEDAIAIMNSYIQTTYKDLFEQEGITALTAIGESLKRDVGNVVKREVLKESFKSIYNSEDAKINEFLVRASRGGSPRDKANKIFARIKALDKMGETEKRDKLAYEAYVLSLKGITVGQDQGLSIVLLLDAYNYNKNVLGGKSFLELSTEMSKKYAKNKERPYSTKGFTP